MSVRARVVEFGKVELYRMGDAPRDRDILCATTDCGCKGWIIVHWADGGGEEQPRFRGWWIPLPELNG